MFLMVAANQTQYNKFIKEHRGQGHGSNYHPWLTVRDLASQGRSHRILGHTTSRTYHLFSDLELAVFLILDWNKCITDMREQFPLRIEDTEEVAASLKVKHPYYKGHNQIMTSDFLVNSSLPKIMKFSLQVKYSTDLNDVRVIEKLEIERRYWKKKNIPWFIITEKEISPVILENIKWLYPVSQALPDTRTNESERIDFYKYQFRFCAGYNVITFSQLVDKTYSLEPGTTLSELRYLIANRYILFDISVSFRVLLIESMFFANTTSYIEKANA